MVNGIVHVVGLEERELETIRFALADRSRLVPHVAASAADSSAMAVIHGGDEAGLARWAELHPRIARIRVADPEATRVAIARGGAAHAYLQRPITPESVRANVDRALYLHTLLQDDAIRELVDELGTLPAQPLTYQALCTVLVRPTSSLRDAARVIERDVAVSTRVLQLVNSAMYSLPRQVASVEQAVSLLGLRAVQDLVLAVEVFGELMPLDPVPGVSLQSMQAVAHATGTLARVLAAPRDADHAYMAGLLSYLGRMVLVAKAPERYRAALYLTQTDLPLEEAEEAVFGVRSLDLAAWLLAMWGLPWEVVDAVRTCDGVPVPDGGALPIAGAVLVASCLVAEARTRDTDEPLVAVTREMVEPWGLRPRMPLLRGLAQSLVRGLEEPPQRRRPPVMAA
jgi:HD-like signal output (HDOD) protein